MKTINRIINFIRKYRCLVRAFAILNAVGIALSVFYAIGGLADNEDWQSVRFIINLVSVSSIIGIIGSLALWFITTRLMRYWPLIIVLYILCLVLSQLAVLIIYTTYNRPLDGIDKLICYGLQGVSGFIEIFILICFWNDPVKIHVKDL